MAPTCEQWRVTGKSGFQDLKLHNVPIPKPGDHEVLMQWKYGSLNYRDLIIPKASGAPSKNTTDVNPRYRANIPSTRKTMSCRAPMAPVSLQNSVQRVKSFKKGDRVAGIFTSDHQAGPIKPEYMGSSLDGATDGVFQEYGVLE
jgi:hypothetical protein